MDTVHYQLTIPPELQGARLDQALADLLPDYSRARIKAWILAGQVALDGARVAPRTRVSGGQRVELDATLQPQGSDAGQAMDIDVMFEDPDLIVVNKPAGLVVHPGAGNAAGTLLNGLLHRWPELAALPRCGLIHRLDKDTSGLLLVARSVAAHTRLVQDLQARRVVREYRAVCEGRLTAGGTVDAPVVRHPQHRARMAVTERGRPAVTHYRVLVRFAAHTFLAVRLETGRTHQIRVHFAHIQHPLVGDRVYGRLRLPAGADPGVRAALETFPRQALHASRLAFVHPRDGRALEFACPLPPDFLGLLGALAQPGTTTPDFDSLTWPAADPSSR
jgi:23S rRNA pseudouridine1911/1915/1917 synthase